MSECPPPPHPAPGGQSGPRRSLSDPAPQPSRPPAPGAAHPGPTLSWLSSQTPSSGGRSPRARTPRPSASCPPAPPAAGCPSTRRPCLSRAGRRRTRAAGKEGPVPGLTWEVTLLRWACGAELAPAGAWLSPTPGGQGDGGAREDAGVWAEEPSSPKVTGRRAGRRYTLTEGDFHHLKNARLTHLHLPPLKIVTIHECDSGEASATATPHPTAAPKASLAIFQVSWGWQLARSSGAAHPPPAGTTFPTLWLRPSPPGGEWGLAGSSGWRVHHAPPPPVLFDLSLLPPHPGSVPQPPGKALTGRSVGPSSALPGDPYNSAVGPADFEISPSASSDSGEGTSVRPPRMHPPSHSRTGQPGAPCLVPELGRKRGRWHTGHMHGWLTCTQGSLTAAEGVVRDPSQPRGRDPLCPGLGEQRWPAPGQALGSLSGRVSGGGGPGPPPAPCSSSAFCVSAGWPGLGWH